MGAAWLTHHQLQAYRPCPTADWIDVDSAQIFDSANCQLPDPDSADCLLAERWHWAMRACVVNGLDTRDPVAGHGAACDKQKVHSWASPDWQMALVLSCWWAAVLML